MEIKATQKYILTSPKKIREVAGMVKRLTPVQALERLPFINKRSANELKKVIAVAIANAKERGEADANNLIFKEILINEGPRLKRWRAGARGRAKPYKRRMSHIRVVLTTKDVRQSEGVETNVKKKITQAAKSKIKNQNANIQSKNVKSDAKES
ncbi:50S ribosomal protein L22 [Candidatus Woesebacteria bacterium RIFCSPLOWO2_01_FULL_39_61]|uniref:Large ribosomal subunit protein uL22 n=2 Tax=Microgenomates group TaxID=1794810 RepID=A0A0H4T5H1_9BACT|nr:50S ribosomal protein L22, large subunit ribosomal protein L22 [uncultured Microgenomates bacterium Rifle_16ft_4_minimus_37836]OGM28083.1 MAG: 50S ribosomal protein L22 [Candidatus Woesebacteria bacterium RIFCSPHIGHO2_01_FULL_39_95]OGM34071.1 MAG: 50S ribosomal protein L22 [Candidatus Woesebacteria bacterium RIFCSPHIGHO2_02_FULL_39_13]OGM38330.1 MAG: 50S ribosomal protein L22 [Candidatus Woesebacteria bacterium RIFCSPHIGHO2_12_FULL_40_20]OGM67793.1 MAG: 50S ribosomal protein L22 [Candidatus 